ncbi:MAG TPA: MFS transporter [Planctomycetota bacterium]|nr:MFS transporter [Planctomycetota bacterium]
MSSSRRADSAENLPSPPENSRTEPDGNLAAPQGFHRALDPHVLSRSMFLSAFASMLGATFFTVIQGTVFNFLLEDLHLRDRLPYFTALWCIGQVGNLVGSWIQDRWNRRKALFLITIGGSRLVWMAIGLLPLLKPEWRDPDIAFWWLSALTVLFYFLHSLGGPAWLSWMADLVPPEKSGRYWSLRQLGCSATGMVGGTVAGYFLDLHHNWNGYAMIFCVATVLGVADALTFIWVEHRDPQLRTSKSHVLAEFVQRLREVPFRRLCGVYILWSISNCFINPTTYFFMRDRVQMGVTSIAVVTAISVAALTVFSLFWGKYSDRHGHRGPLIVCLLLHAAAPVIFFFAGPHDVAYMAIGMAIIGIGGSGINLFMLPMLIGYTENKSGGREVGIATFHVVLNLANFAALLLADGILFNVIGALLGQPPRSTPVYIGIMVISMLLRVLAAAFVYLLPQAENETAPGVVLTEVVTTSPLRATISLMRYVSGKQKWKG